MVAPPAKINQRGQESLTASLPPPVGAISSQARGQIGASSISWLVRVNRSAFGGELKSVEFGGAGLHGVQVGLFARRGQTPAPPEVYKQ